MPTCRIRILGPVRAWRNGLEVTLGPPKQRLVLALLAVAQGQVVTVSEITEALWDTTPPRSAVNVVQTYLKGLRRALEPNRPQRHPSELLPSVYRGYALAADPDAVDVWQFRRLLSEARRAAEPGLILARLTEALSLWRDAPSGALPALGHHHRMWALGQEYASAANWYAQTALSAGDPAEALPIVATVAAARPLDEPLQAALLRLYHTTGQRSEAMRVYLTCQRRLRDELGFDPGPELSGAYHELLRHRQPPAGR